MKMTNDTSYLDVAYHTMYAQGKVRHVTTYSKSLPFH